MFQLSVYIYLLQLCYSASLPNDASQNESFRFEDFRGDNVIHAKGLSPPNERFIRGLQTKSGDPSTSPELSAHIVGGIVVSAPQRYPYLAVMTNDFSEFSHLCAASLVAEDFVLSAAHCTKYFMGEIGMGVTDLRDLVSDPIPNYANVYGIAEYFIHPDYDQYNLKDDIVLYKIKQKVSPKYTPVKLNVDIDLANTYEPNNDSTTVMGWGYTSDNGQISAELRHVDIDPISHEECYNKWWDATGYKYKVDETTQLCCFTEGKSTCNGDSGGPLILKGDNVQSDTQVGIVSFGSSLGCNHLPTVFTRIDTKIDWIKSVLCEHSVSPPAYLCSDNAADSTPPDRKPPVEFPLITETPPADSNQHSLVPKILVKIEVLFDHKPWETGWKLEQVHNNHLNTTVIASAESGTYQIAGILASEIFPLDRYSNYRLTVTDDASDGLREDAYVRAYILIDDVPLKIFEIQEFGNHSVENFYLGRHKTETQPEDKEVKNPITAIQSLQESSSSYFNPGYIFYSTCVLMTIWISS